VFVRKAEVERLCSVIPVEDRIRSAVPPAGAADA
jgi:hypothetical protein